MADDYDDAKSDQGDEKEGESALAVAGALPGRELTGADDDDIGSWAGSLEASGADALGLEGFNTYSDDEQ